MAKNIHITVPIPNKSLDLIAIRAEDLGVTFPEYARVALGLTSMILSKDLKFVDGTGSDVDLPPLKSDAMDIPGRDKKDGKLNVPLDEASSVSIDTRVAAEGTLRTDYIRNSMNLLGFALDNPEFNLVNNEGLIHHFVSEGNNGFVDIPRSN